MKLWIIVQTGIYRHDITGPHTTIEHATTAAADLAHLEADGYHEYEIHELDTYNPDTIDEPVRIVARTGGTGFEPHRGPVGYWDMTNGRRSIVSRSEPDGHF